MKRALQACTLSLWASPCSGTAGAQISVTVSPDYSAIHHQSSGLITRAKLTSVHLFDNIYHDSYRVSIVAPRGRVNILVLDNRDIAAKATLQAWRATLTAPASTS